MQLCLARTLRAGLFAITPHHRRFFILSGMLFTIRCKAVAIHTAQKHTADKKRQKDEIKANFFSVRYDLICKTNREQ